MPYTRWSPNFTPLKTHQFEIGGIACRRMEAGITQDDHPPINLLNEPLKGVVRDIGRGTAPRDDQAVLVHHKT